MKKADHFANRGTGSLCWLDLDLIYIRSYLSHYHYFDGGHQLSSMRRMMFEGEISDIVISHTHFIFVIAAVPPGSGAASGTGGFEPERVLARDVRVGDSLLWYNAIERGGPPRPRVAHRAGDGAAEADFLPAVPFRARECHRRQPV